MTDDTGNDEIAKRRVAWLRSLLAEMEKLEVPSAALAEVDETAPQWVHALEKQFALAMLPAAKLKKGNEITPRRFGAILGHQCVMAVWMTDWFGSSEARRFIADTSNDTPDHAEHADTSSLGKWYKGMRRLAKKALCSSVDQSYEDMSEFLVGFADGFRRKPRTFKASDLGNTAFEIHLFMRIYWQSIASLNSVSQLHTLLVKTFGDSRVGDLKRVEKICQRIGLTFRTPGRPKHGKLK